MVNIDIGDPEEALRILDRLKVSDYSAKTPTDITVYAWMKNLREQIHEAILESRDTPVDVVWKAIPQLPEYEINEHGTVRSAKSHRELSKYEDTANGLTASVWCSVHACFISILIDPIVKVLFDVDPNR